MRNLTKRTLTGVCFGPIVALLFYFLSPELFLGLLVLISAAAIVELSTISKIKHKFFVVVLALISLVILNMQHLQLFLLWLVCSPGIYLFFRILWPGNDGGSENQEITKTIGLLYVSIISIVLPLYFLYLLKRADNLFPLMLLLTLWASDSAAYLVGTRFGKTKLVPVISPKKTYEGLFGAMMGALVVMFLFRGKTGMTVIESCCVGAFVGFLGQMGDILESVGKRFWAVKDSSGLIPGHGGILDRMDSFIFAAPFVFEYLTGFSR